MHQAIGVDLARAAPPCPADLVANAVENGLAHVGLEAPRVARTDRADGLERAKQGLLHEVAGVEQGPGVSWQPARRPPLEAGAGAREQSLERVAAPLLRLAQAILGAEELGAVPSHSMPSSSNPTLLMNARQRGSAWNGRLLGMLCTSDSPKSRWTYAFSSHSKVASMSPRMAWVSAICTA